MIDRKIVLKKLQKSNFLGIGELLKKASQEIDFLTSCFFVGDCYKYFKNNIDEYVFVSRIPVIDFYDRQIEKVGTFVYNPHQDDWRSIYFKQQFSSRLSIRHSEISYFLKEDIAFRRALFAAILKIKV